MVEKILLSPLPAFLIIFLALVMLARILRGCAFPKTDKSAGAQKSYACGEDLADQPAQPDYSQFFPFAFFFTILHVIALVIATVPKPTLATLVMAALYLAGASVGLLILIRK